jgi:hypothetical protein
MPSSVRVAQVVITIHGLVLCLPYPALWAWAATTYSPSSGHSDGGLGLITVAAVTIFPIGLFMIAVGLTGFPFWRMSRWAAYFVEVGFGLTLWIWFTWGFPWPWNQLISVLFGVGPAVLIIYLLSRPRADGWFRHL